MLEVPPLDDALHDLVHSSANDIRRALSTLQFLAQSSTVAQYSPERLPTTSETQWQSSAAFNAMYHSHLPESWQESSMKPLFDTLTREHNKKYDQSHRILTQSCAENTQRFVWSCMSSMEIFPRALILLELNCMIHSNTSCKSKPWEISRIGHRFILTIDPSFDKSVKANRNERLNPMCSDGELRNLFLNRSNGFDWFLVFGMRWHFAAVLYNGLTLRFYPTAFNDQICSFFFLWSLVFSVITAISNRLFGYIYPAPLCINTSLEWTMNLFPHPFLPVCYLSRCSLPAD